MPRRKLKQAETDPKRAGSVSLEDDVVFLLGGTPYAGQYTPNVNQPTLAGYGYGYLGEIWKRLITNSATNSVPTEGGSWTRIFTKAAVGAAFDVTDTQTVNLTKDPATGNISADANFADTTDIDLFSDAEGLKAQLTPARRAELANLRTDLNAAALAASIWQYVGNVSNNNVSRGAFGVGNVLDTLVFTNNTFGFDFAGNTLRGISTGSVYGDYCQNNDFGNFSNSTISNGAQNNTFASVGTCRIGYQFRRNTVGSNFSNNRVGSDVTDCIIGADTQRIDIGDTCAYLRIGAGTRNVRIVNCRGTAASGTVGQPGYVAPVYFDIPAGAQDALYQNNLLVTQNGTSAPPYVLEPGNDTNRGGFRTGPTITATDSDVLTLADAAVTFAKLEPALQALLGAANGDADNVVNALREMLAVLQNFPEGANLQTRLVSLERAFTALNVSNVRYTASNDFSAAIGFAGNVGTVQLSGNVGLSVNTTLPNKFTIAGNGCILNFAGFTLTVPDRAILDNVGLLGPGVLQSSSLQYNNDTPVLRNPRFTSADCLFCPANTFIIVESPTFEASETGAERWAYGPGTIILRGNYKPGDRPLDPLTKLIFEARGGYTASNDGAKRYNDVPLFSAAEFIFLAHVNASGFTAQVLKTEDATAWGPQRTTAADVTTDLKTAFAATPAPATVLVRVEPVRVDTTRMAYTLFALS